MEKKHDIEHKHEVRGHHNTAHHTDVKDDNKEDDGKKHKMSLLYMFIGVAIVAVIFVAAILLSKYAFTDDQTVIYNQYVFQKFEGNKWMTQQLIKNQLYNIPFYNNPEQVLDIPVDPNAVRNIRLFREYSNGTVYITVDPDESSRVVLAGVEYARLLGTSYNIYNMNVKSAISQPVKNMDYQIITCDNQSTNTFVIYQRVTDKNLVSVNGNCITLESRNANESVRVADAFAFRLLNIIRDNQTDSTTNN